MIEGRTGDPRVEGYGDPRQDLNEREIFRLEHLLHSISYCFNYPPPFPPSPPIPPSLPPPPTPLPPSSPVVPSLPGCPSPLVLKLGRFINSERRKFHSSNGIEIYRGKFARFPRFIFSFLFAELASFPAYVFPSESTLSCFMAPRYL